MFRLPKIGFRLTPNSIVSTRHISNDITHLKSSPEIEETISDMPEPMKNPYIREKPMCILCKYQIKPDYKNVRLLSQFVSRFTGKIYTRNITGLCKQQQANIEIEIIKAFRAGLIPKYFRDPRFSHDPQLFDPDKPFRPHRF